MSFQSVIRKMRRARRLQRRIDCRWCGSTNFVEAWILYLCPQCKAIMPDHLVVNLRTYEIVFVYLCFNMYLILHIDQIPTFEQFWLWNHTVERYKNVLSFLYLENVWGLHLTIFIVSISIVKLFDFLLVKLHLLILRWWGWTFQAKTANWVCIPTPQPKHYLFRELYLYIIRPIGIHQVTFPTGVIGLILGMAINSVPLPLNDLDLFSYIRELILLMGMLGLLIGIVPHKNAANRLIASLLAFYVALVFWPAEIGIMGWLFDPTPQFSAILGWMKVISIIPLTITFIGSVYVGIELSIFLFGKSKFGFITSPISIEEMQHTRTLPQAKQHWFDSWGEEDEELTEADKILDKILRLMVAPVFLFFYNWIPRSHRKTKLEWEKAISGEMGEEREAREKEYQESLKEINDWEEIKKGYLFALREDKNGNLNAPVIFMPKELLTLFYTILRNENAKSCYTYSIKLTVPFEYKRAYTECLYSLTVLNGYELITEDLIEAKIIAQTVYHRFYRSEIISLNLTSIAMEVTEIEVVSQSIHRWQIDWGTNRSNVEKIQMYFSKRNPK